MRHEQHINAGTCGAARFLVDKPDVKGREEVLRIHTKNVKLSPTVDLKIVAARTAVSYRPIGQSCELAPTI